MAITDQDIRLMASEVLSDTPDGGGRITGQEVIDGVSNNLFPDVSELDRTIGRVSLRKAYPAVLSANRDTYFGVNTIIDQAPLDPNVSVTMFTTEDWTDTRDAAVSRMESYLARGPKYDGYLWDQHIAGQKALLIVQRPDRELPPIGTTLVLVKDAGKTTEYTQFVRVLKVSSQDRTFSSSGCSGEFIRTVVTCEISDPLQVDMLGGQPNCIDDVAEHDADTKVYTTVVADAAKYAGMTTLAEPVAMGAYTIKAKTIFGQLVPSAQVESAITDARPHGDSAIPIAAGGQVTLTTSADWDSTHTLYAGQGIYPGSLTVTIGGTTITDKAGVLLSGGVQVGTVDYANGILRIVDNGPDYGTASKSISFTPAAFPIRNMQTAAWDITPESRSGTIVFMLDPVAAPGSLSIHYMAQGKWYVLRDDGSGALRGTDSAYGSGTINYSTGSVVVTLGALPDVGSSVIAVWGTKLVDMDRSGGTVKAMMRMENIDTGLDASGNPNAIAKNNLTIAWLGSDGIANSATDDGAGNLTGDATGRVHYIDRWVDFAPNAMPSGGAQINVVTGYAETSEAITSIIGNVITLAAAPKPGSIVLNLPSSKGWLRVYDDGNGNLKHSYAPAGPFGAFDALETVGTVNYTTGECVITASTMTASWDELCEEPKSELLGYSCNGNTCIPYPSTWTNFYSCYKNESVVPDISAAVARYQSTEQLGTRPEQTFTWSPIIDLTPGYAETIVAGSVRLTLGSKTLIDRSGRMDMDIDPATGAGTQAGTLSYATGEIVLTAWVPGDTNAGTVHSMLTTLGGFGTNEVTFRTASAPLRSGSLILQFEFFDAAGLITVTSTTDGLLTAPDVDGRVDFQTGIVRVGFGTWVPVTPEIEAEPWYFPEAVVNGMAFRPRPVLADTLRYAAVAYSYIPLDKDILGIDPVRLPTDGRVPIFRVGDVGVVHHTASASLATLTVPQTVNLGRTRLSRVWLFDEGNADTRVPTTHYTADLDAGTVTLTDATGLIGPIRIEHRIEDMALISDAQINGQLTFTRPITHDYPAQTTGVSSALVIGDMQSRATKPFDQQTWTGEWSDALIGNATTAEYNATTYPIVVDNIGSIQERWALIFNTPTEVRVIGESVGQIATLPIAAEIAPLNPNTNAPYFRIDPLGWGSGWAAGNVLRFNTIAANYPVWIARTVQQGPATVWQDAFRIQIRGDADAT